MAGIRKNFSANTPTSLVYAQIMTALQEIDNKFHTNVITDEDGVRRIVFGRLPDGTVGLVISEEGVDVLTLF